MSATFSIRLNRNEIEIVMVNLGVERQKDISRKLKEVIVIGNK